MSYRKGIILAGGYGTRLAPLTSAISKQILPIYDKPMIYYALSTLMLSGIKEILIISSGRDLGLFQNLLGSGEKWGIKLEYLEQKKPAGIAEAFLLGNDFIGNSSSALILGDNLFYGENLISLLSEINLQESITTLFAYPVKDPERYGVVEFDDKFNVIDIHEKPENPPSNYAITGLYFYDNSVLEKARKLTPSKRGELEISDLNKLYLNTGKIKVKVLGRGIAWLDTGTFESLHEASSFIKSIENRQGLKIGCPEEISWRKGWIDDDQLEKLAFDLRNSQYGEYLSSVKLNKYNYKNN